MEVMSVVDCGGAWRVGLGWAGLGWAGLGWAGQGRVIYRIEVWMGRGEGRREEGGGKGGLGWGFVLFCFGNREGKGWESVGRVDSLGGGGACSWVLWVGR